MKRRGILNYFFKLFSIIFRKFPTGHVSISSKIDETVIKRKYWIIPSNIPQDGAIPNDYPSNLSRAYLVRVTAHVAEAAIIYRHFAFAKNAFTDSSADA